MSLTPPDRLPVSDQLRATASFHPRRAGDGRETARSPLGTRELPLAGPTRRSSRIAAQFARQPIHIEEFENDADSGDAAHARKIQQKETAAQRAAAHQLRSDEEIARALQAELDNEDRAPALSAAGFAAEAA